MNTQACTHEHTAQMHAFIHEHTETHVCMYEHMCAHHKYTCMRAHMDTQACMPQAHTHACTHEHTHTLGSYKESAAMHVTKKEDCTTPVCSCLI